MTLALYEHPLSSYAQKIKIALREKGVTFETRIPESLGSGQADPDFAAMNPRLEAPVLADGETVIFDSTIILEYVEDRWPSPHLLPKDAAGRAAARIIEEICDTHYEAVNWGYGEILWFARAEGELADRLKARAEAQTATLQAWLTDRLGSGPWFGGDQFGWADVCAAPMVNRSVHYGFPPSAAAGALADWHRRLHERPSVAATFAEFDAAAAAMAGARDRFRAGAGRRREYRDHRLEWMVRSGGIDIVLAGIADDTIRFSWPD